jgi:hypothetical protein
LRAESVPNESGRYTETKDDSGLSPM